MIQTCVVVATEQGDDGIPTVARKDLCGACLVGHDVAVHRASDDEMCFGEVKQYDENQLRPFLMSFLDVDEEWVEISRSPTIEYLNSLDIEQLTPSPPKLLRDGSIGSFSSSSFSSMPARSDYQDEAIFPLFEEAKLIHLNQSFSCLDDASTESIFSDEEGNIEVVQQSTKRNKSTKATRSKSYQSGPGSQKNKKKKQSKPRAPVMWSKAEDTKLQKVVDSFNAKGRPFKWTEIASKVPNRVSYYEWILFDHRVGILFLTNCIYIIERKAVSRALHESSLYRTRP